jgi:hypothetical protein
MKKILLLLFVIFLVGCSSTTEELPEAEYPTYNFDGTWSGTVLLTEGSCDYEGSGTIVLGRRSSIEVDLVLVNGECDSRIVQKYNIEKGTPDGNQIDFLSDEGIFGNAFYVTEKLIGAWNQDNKDFKFEMERINS